MDPKVKVIPAISVGNRPPDRAQHRGTCPLGLLQFLPQFLRKVDQAVTIQPIPPPALTLPRRYVYLASLYPVAIPAHPQIAHPHIRPSLLRLTVLADRVQ